MADWKDTLNLPRTAFPMKANLQTAEPQVLARWETQDLYGRLRARRAGAPRFVLHDGPPYANGRIHLGTALNKILKDFVVRSRSMAGFDAPYVPGWDCHGLPIELKVDRELGARKRELSIIDFRRACRTYAEKYVGVQRDDFKRLGVMGAWNDPYLTMKLGLPGDDHPVAGGLRRNRAPSTRARSPCTGASIAGRRWPRPRSSTNRTPRRRLTWSSPSVPRGRGRLASESPRSGAEPVSVLIWTTTPWTIPSNLAIAFHPEFTYGAYPVDGAVVIVAEPLAAEVARRTGRTFGAPVATFAGRVMEGICVPPPPVRTGFDWACSANT